MSLQIIARFVPAACVIALLAGPLPSAETRSGAGAASGKAPTAASASKSGKKVKAGVAANPARKRRIAYNRWTEPNYADSAAGDILAGEDLVVRQAALAALGLLNGTVVVVDPNTGRILTIVNQKLAFQSGFQPCSTVKVFTALAALSEGLIGRTSLIRISKRTSMNLTEALAVSNNPYFAALGQKLGFERVRYYGRLFGLGETAGLGIAEEEPGILPEVPPANGGVGMMTSFGEGITLTPLELASLLSAIANGGTMYYLQHPRSQAELDYFVPRVKRNLDIQPFIPEVKPGLLGATEFGTARRASYSADEPIYGKTGTCTDRRSSGTHLGWFGSFNEVGGKKLVVVVLLTGGSAVSGPVASGVAGAVYRNLSMGQFFARESTPSPATLNVARTCCVE
ncbi:MAG: penicillin-binding protein [Bryobacteraceae bacterium]|nr:penicillin-binding protein [Bryobacteraceae bacterium]